MELGLKGKTALVTGGSRGIGYGIASVLAAEGCNLLLASAVPHRWTPPASGCRNRMATSR